MSKQQKMLIHKAFKTDGIVISSSSILQGTPVSIGCASCLVFNF